MDSQNIRIIRLSQAPVKTGLSRSTIYSKLNPDSSQYDPTFPKSIKLSERSTGFLESEIDQWIIDKAAIRDINVITVNTALYAGRDAARKVRNEAKKTNPNK